MSSWVISDGCTIEEDSMTGDMIDEYDIIDTNIICDYCVIPEADNILKGLTSQCLVWNENVQ